MLTQQCQDDSRPSWAGAREGLGTRLSRPHSSARADMQAFVLCQQNARDYIQYSTSYAVCVPRGCHMTADTAQPFSGWGLGTRTRM